MYIVSGFGRSCVDSSSLEINASRSSSISGVRYPSSLRPSKSPTILSLTPSSLIVLTKSSPGLRTTEERNREITVNIPESSEGWRLRRLSRERAKRERLERKEGKKEGRGVRVFVSCSFFESGFRAVLYGG